MNMCFYELLWEGWENYLIKYCLSNQPRRLIFWSFCDIVLDIEAKQKADLLISIILFFSNYFRNVH